MPERPLLILPSPGEPVARRKKGVGGGQFHRPSPERQAERLSPRFERLQRALEERRARLQMEARDLVPEPGYCTKPEVYDSGMLYGHTRRVFGWRDCCWGCLSGERDDDGDVLDKPATAAIESTVPAPSVR